VIPLIVVFLLIFFYIAIRLAANKSEKTFLVSLSPPEEEKYKKRLYKNDI
jgi:hypothetical protein